MPEWTGEIRARLRNAGLQGAVEAAVAEELGQHLEDRYQELRARNVPEAAARAAALDELAGEGELARQLRQVARRRARAATEAPALGAEPARSSAGVWTDLRFAWRLLRRSPGFTLVAVFTLAVAIGANTAIFSAVNAVVLRPLPFRDAGRLFMLWEENPEKGWHENVTAPANVLDWQERVAGFEDVAAYTEPSGTDSEVSLTADGPPEVVQASQVTGNLFSVLGVRAQVGRTLRAEETWQGTEAVVVISHRLWVQRYGAAPGVVGRLVVVNGKPRRVVGVMPASFAFPVAEVDVWLPTLWDPANRTQQWFRRAHWLRAIARLRPGVTAEQANAQLQAVVGRLKVEYPATNRYMGAGMTPLHRFLVGDTRVPLLVLLAAVGLLLLIACANVGNLLLVKAVGRQREIAVRISLGARRRRLVRQLLTESLLLSALGGATGLLLGWGGTRLLERLQPPGLLRVSHFAIDPRVLAYLVLITAASGLLFGAAPALWTGRGGPRAALGEGGRTGAPGRGARRAARALVVAEVALALLVVVSAGLLARSFRRLAEVSPGFDPRGVLTVTVMLPEAEARYSQPEQGVAFFDALLHRIRALPGVESAAATSALPLDGIGWTSDFAVAGRGPDEYGTEVAHRRITPGYFATMRVPLVRGRDVAASDRVGAANVVVINDVLARKFFSGQDPIGQRIAFDKHPDAQSRWWTIVGVVGGERQARMALEPQIEVYQPMAQDASSGMALVVRARGDPLSLVPAIRRAVAEQDPDLPLFAVRTMEQIRAHALAGERFLMLLLLLFAGVALLLAVVGVYGITAQAARQQTQEIGVRLALGAQRSDVVRLVVRQAVALLAGGLLLGLLAALATMHLLTSLLYGVAPTDPATFVAVVGLLAGAGLLASWLPARRASRLDPLLALRAE